HWALLPGSINKQKFNPRRITRGSTLLALRLHRFFTIVSVLSIQNSTINTPLHLDSIELPPTLTDLDLTVNRLSELDSRIAHLSMLKKLSLRQNLIEDSAVEPLSRWDALSDLEELILRDNKLAEVPDISIFSRLLVFDVSFNEITSLEGLSKASSTLKELYNSTINTPLHLDSIELPPTLTDLDLTVNRLSELDSRIAHLSMLKKLSLRQNLIEDSAVEPLSRWDALSDLEELILRDNKLAEVPDISIFSRLLVFDVSFNEITSLEGLSKASSTLKELYNSTINTPLHLDSIELPPTLTDLDLTVNRLSELDSRIAHLSMLKKLSLRQNLIEDSAVEPLSRWDALSDLEELILRDNKLAEVPDISIFSRLLVFDVSFNEITSLEGLSKASSTLKELYVSKNLNYTKR
uniref:Uncharacterized protein n=2 Tax=Brassica oleracea var. oleracea TaxID=109376 RepID=A0A0D3AP70_BRAOL